MPKERVFGDSLYQFYPFDEKDHSINNVVGCKMYFNTMPNFNDPFEGRVRITFPEYCHLLHDQYHQVAKRLIKLNLLSPDDEFSRSSRSGPDSYDFLERKASVLDAKMIYPVVSNYGITCLSSEKDGRPHPLGNPLMWSHYGDGFKGFCIQFDAERLMSAMNEHGAWPLVVQYEEKRPSINAFRFFEVWGKEGEEYPFTTEQIVQKSLATKSFPWAYEGEIRFVHARVKDQTLSYPVDAIRKVVISENGPALKVRELKKALKSIGIEEYYSVRLHDFEYGVTEEGPIAIDD